MAAADITKLRRVGVELPVDMNPLLKNDRDLNNAPSNVFPAAAERRPRAYGVASCPHANLARNRHIGQLFPSRQAHFVAPPYRAVSGRNARFRRDEQGNYSPLKQLLAQPTMPCD